MTAILGRAACLAGIFAVLLSLFSCAAVGIGKRTPEILLSDIEVDQSTLFETSFTLYLRVLNRGTEEVVLNGAECDFYLERTRMLVGLMDQQEVIPPRGSVLVPIYAYASNVDMVPYLDGVIQRVQGRKGPRKVYYRLKGVLFREGGFMTGDLEFDQRGQIALEGINKLHENLKEMKDGMQVTNRQMQLIPE
ncbi:MAG: LEA type 2 family protein [Deltaproteobacteria bacterium]|nr:LEA type 2 family protein [Deltaproteobacteria bacterium]